MRFFRWKQYNVLLIFKFLINYSPLAYISLSFFVYLSSDVSGLRSPGVHGENIIQKIIVMTCGLAPVVWGIRIQAKFALVRVVRGD